MRTRTLVVLLLLLGASTPCTALAVHFNRTVKVDCDSGWQTIARALQQAETGDTIRIEGHCRETLTLDKGVTLEGSGRARISPADPSHSTITVTARDVTLRGLRLEAPALFQVFVHGAASLLIESSTIRNAQNFGISAATNSNVALLGNTISDNGLGGIIGLSGAELSVGSLIAFDAPRPNLIADNGQFGMVLASGAGAQVLGGNTISGHDLGIAVQSASHARIAGNVIADNDIGIFLDSGANVQLPLAANPVALFTELNSGSNGRFGIACKGGSIQGVVDGLGPAVRLPPGPGALTGADPGLVTHCLDQTESLPAAP
jgi:parallel beta-helix repeat protein